jgi:hypothetical protein
VSAGIYFNYQTARHDESNEIVIRRSQVEAAGRFARDLVAAEAQVTR